ncbi:cell division protein CrgA [Agreia sp. COWG]|uniref:cell division protein CrgA n=1 Tax=Agreia sp. COWG TaxID=2773266 RepID=UPI001925C602|nr:cell division protein CrgA [Agreia sp. COWG]CAD5989150.1 Cell division protein CrgA [Agreia sp. COWG]
MAREKTRSPRTDVAKTAPVSRSSDESAAPNPVWFKPVMFGFMLVGLAWIITFYVSQAKFPIPDLGSWNILIGFGIAFIGFLMTTRWR